MAEDEPLEADRIEGAPHPRETSALFGQHGAEAAFLDAFNGGRMHHAWLIAGPRGVGKATLAWRIARFLLSRTDEPAGMFAPEPPTTLAIPDDHPVARRTRAMSEPGLLLIRRAWDEKDKKLKTVITVDEVRRLSAFLALSSAEGGRRVVIVDAADEMNPQAANALLKLREEPPKRSTLILVSHAPARLLPTIRSRCRTLRCTALAPGDMSAALAAMGEEPGADAEALADLAGGSVGEALSLIHLDGLKLYRDLAALLDGAPNMDRGRLLSLANAMTGRANAEKFDLTLRLFARLLSRLARTGAGLPPEIEIARGERALLTRLAPDAQAGRHWADLQQSLGARMAHGKAVNLDPSALILDMGLTLNQSAAATSA
ncbi:DNA polymerase III subunit delta' [Oceaniglobus roseus]|uniref:DNA polymerase III subunit delta' n=1 Tax=Oceaniglobus roseus TaxID=1737570 RepID=UPI000C7F251B|nr:DNA polymerase III subunit delta' [Kandeliimicrobium roseum]